MIGINEVWVVHFTCQEDITTKPHWQSDNQKLAGLNVVHFWHDRTFDNVDMIARCLDTNGTVSDIKPERIVRPSVLHSIRNFFSYYT